jgi:hypothetical protein
MSAPARAIRMAAPKPSRARRALGAAGMPGKIPSSLVAWYLGLTHHWLGDNSRIKTRILLRTHEWIVERVLAPEVSLVAAAMDLRRGAALTQSLAALVPPDDAREWHHFIDLVVANLRHALLAPVTQRNEAWVRWLSSHTASGRRPRLFPQLRGPRRRSRTWAERARMRERTATRRRAPGRPAGGQDTATKGSATVTDRAPVWHVARV